MKRLALLVALVLVTLTLTASSARADDESAVPTQPRWGLVAAGLTTFAVPYTAGLVGLTGTGGGAGSIFTALYVPIGGPFAVAGQIFSAATRDGTWGGLDNIVGAFFLLDGAAQLAGAAMTIAGLVAQKPVRRSRVQVAPWTARAGAGFSIAVSTR